MAANAPHCRLCLTALLSALLIGLAGCRSEQVVVRLSPGPSATVNPIVRLAPPTTDSAAGKHSGRTQATARPVPAAPSPAVRHYRPATALRGTALSATRNAASEGSRNLKRRQPAPRHGRPQQPADLDLTPTLGEVLLVLGVVALALVGLPLLVMALLDVTFLAALGIAAGGIVVLVFLSIIVGSYLRRWIL